MQYHLEDRLKSPNKQKQRSCTVPSSSNCVYGLFFCCCCYQASWNFQEPWMHQGSKQDKSTFLPTWGIRSNKLTVDMSLAASKQKPALLWGTTTSEQGQGKCSLLKNPVRPYWWMKETGIYVSHLPRRIGEFRGFLRMDRTAKLKHSCTPGSNR